MPFPPLRFGFSHRFMPAPGWRWWRRGQDEAASPCGPFASPPDHRRSCGSALRRPGKRGLVPTASSGAPARGSALRGKALRCIFAFGSRCGVVMPFPPLPLRCVSPVHAGARMAMVETGGGGMRRPPAPMDHPSGADPSAGGTFRGRVAMPARQRVISSAFPTRARSCSGPAGRRERVTGSAFTLRAGTARGMFRRDAGIRAILTVRGPEP